MFLTERVYYPKKERMEQQLMSDETPIGFVMSMALNEAARDRFAGLSYEQRRELERTASLVSSRQEMDALVRELAEGKMPGTGIPKTGIPKTGIPKTK